MNQKVALVMNLRHIADEHKKLCDDSCNVSLELVREAAKFITDTLTSHADIRQARTFLTNWPY